MHAGWAASWAVGAGAVIGAGVAGLVAFVGDGAPWWLLVGALIGAAVSARGTGRRAPGTSLDGALEAVAGRMERPVQLDELLQQAVDALRAAPARRAIELWQVRDDALVLTHRSPLVDRAPITLDRVAASVAGTVGTVGDAWLRTWIPQLAGPIAAAGRDAHDDGARDATASARAGREIGGRSDDGPTGDATRVAPLAAHGELVGMIVLRRGADDARFGADDDRRLGQIQRPLAAALNQARLTAALQATVTELRQRNIELQASRARLVSAAEHERRRLERDLHDGAQAQLNALQMRLQFVRRVAAESPEQVDALLAATAGELAVAIAELRRLAHGLVPALLVTGGLGEALREAASRTGVDVQVTVADVGRFPAAIEAAVYYCCVEALQNVAKHAGPDATALVEVVRRDGLLVFTVSDDGCGFGPSDAAGCLTSETTGMYATRGTNAGQGLLNITDRIGALGGTVEVTATPGDGTVVHGQVPITTGDGERTAGDVPTPASVDDSDRDGARATGRRRQPQ